MTEQLEQLLHGVTLEQPGASVEEIDELEEELGVKLPGDLRWLLAEADGGSGTLGGKRPLVLWGAEQIADEAEAQEVSLATPGLVLFGTDGGAEGYAYLPRLQQGRFGRISLLAAGAHEFESLGDTLRELLEAVASGR